LLASIDFTKTVVKPEIYLCMPNRTIVAKLSEAYNITSNYKLASINEISFEITSEIEIHHVLQSNPNFDKIKEKYLLKFIKGDYIEFYIINKITDQTNDSTDSRTVHAYSLPYELASKSIKNYKSAPINGEAMPSNCSTALNEILAETLWKIDYIDASFDILYRPIEISSASVLDSINQIASTFTALIIWNTTDRTISMYNPDDFGVNRGLRFSTQKLMKEVTLISSADEMVTRLKVFGKDDLTISSVSQTGNNFIENYGYFMNTDYMSQSLIDAMVSYNALITSSKGNFTTYLSNLNAFRETLITKSTELTNLNTAMNIILNNLDIAQSTSADTTILLAQKVAQQVLIDAKQVEIDATNASIIDVNLQITNLQDTISIENNFTIEQIAERNYFIIEKEIANSNISDAQDLYDWGIKEFEKIKEPQISVTLDIINFLEVLEEQNNWNKLNLGDWCSVYYPKLNINIKCKIVEFTINYESASVSLTIANVTLVLSDEQKFYKNLYGAITTSTTVNNNVSQWNNIGSVKNSVSDILNNSWDSAKNAINSGVNQSVVMNSRGLTIYDSNDPNKFIRMTNGCIGLTQNSTDFKTAITPSGSVLEYIKFKIIKL